MSVASLVTRGFSNGTFIGSIPELVTMGYTIGENIVWTMQDPTTTSWAVQSKVASTWVTQSNTATTWTVKQPSS